MNVASLLDSVSRANGGIFHAERRRQQELAQRAGITVEVLGLEDSSTAADIDSWLPLKPRVFPVVGPAFFGYSPRLVAALLQTKADLVHAAGLWKYPSLAASIWHRRTRRPHLISPHGMLDAWALQNSGWKKQCAAVLYEQAHLRSAACLHALCDSEAASIRGYGLKNPICVLPNGVDLPSGTGNHPPLAGPSPFSPDRPTLLYLGRLHPKKGLANLLQAWSMTRSGRGNDWRLALAGWDQGGHEAELKRQATELGLPWADAASPNSHDSPVLFLGPQYGRDKEACYRDCAAFVLPSFSEGLPLVILEAWASAKPVVMTPECNLPEGFAAHAALRIDPKTDRIAEGLRQLFEMSGNERQAMGQNGLALVKARFTWPKIAADMASVYAWVLGGGPRPACVEIS